MNRTLIKDILISLGQKICDQVYLSLQEQSAPESLSRIAHTGDDDVIYEIDKNAEDLIISFLSEKAEELGGIVLIGEGIGNRDHPFILPEGKEENSCAIRIITDPIDGTRGIMYDKRSAFFLAGAAPNKGYNTTLRDIEVAVMVELPVSKAAFSDTLWAIRGSGSKGERRNLFTGETKDRPVSPSKAKTIYGGFSQISRFFPPGKTILARIEEELVSTLFPGDQKGTPALFEDQYISSGGQLYEILCGHDRFTGELRASLFRRMKKESQATGHTCHPYDLCAHLIGEEAGIIITDEEGNPLDFPLDTIGDVDWLGYANKDIHKEVWPVLKEILIKERLIASSPK